MSNIRFMTINETARTGLVSGHHLREMLKQGKLPGMYTGRTFRVNYDMLLEQLQRESAANAVNAQRGGE